MHRGELNEILFCPQTIANLQARALVLRAEIDAAECTKVSSLEEELVTADSMLERTLADAEVVRADVVSMSDADFVSSAPTLEGRTHALLDAVQSAQGAAVDATLMLMLAGNSDLLLASIAIAIPPPPVEVPREDSEEADFGVGLFGDDDEW